MTRTRTIDWAAVEREYIYDANTPPVSFTELAERHGIARSNITDKGRIGRWYERREEFRKTLGEKTVAAMGDAWLQQEIARREQILAAGHAYVDRYIEALQNGDIKVSTRDFLGMVAMIRAFQSDIAAATPGGTSLIDPDRTEMDPAEARRAIRLIESLTAQHEEEAVDDTSDATWRSALP